MITVAFYNILTSNLDYRQPPGRTWTERLPYVVANILTYPIDILGLLEINVSMLNDLRKVLPQYNFCGLSTMHDKPLEELTIHDHVDELVVIAYRKDIILCSEVTAQRLTPDILISGRYPRIVIHARFHIQDTYYSIFATHYDPHGRTVDHNYIQKECAFIHLMSKGDIIFAGGDRNWYPDAGGSEDLQKYMTLSGLTPCQSQNHHGPLTTWLGYETDPYHIQNLDEPRVYDVIFSNRPSVMSFHLPGQYDNSGILPVDEFHLTDPLYTASDHCLVGTKIDLVVN